MQAKKYSPSWRWFFLEASPIINLMKKLINIVDEVPSQFCANQESGVFKDIQVLLNKHCREEPNWADNIKKIQSNLMQKLIEKQPWINIKQMLREDCDFLLTPYAFSFDKPPKLLEKLKEMLESIPSERYIKHLDLPQLIENFELIQSTKALYFSKQPQDKEIRKQLKLLKLETQHAHHYDIPSKQKKAQCHKFY